jgi:hypothetical protein
MWPFWQSKTVWTAIITVIAGLGFYFTGEINLVDLTQITSFCALITFLRHGVAKAEQTKRAG